MSRDENRNCRAFTLVELLVVIAIIAILAALLLSALASSKMRAQQINCMSNIKQLTMAGLMYMGEGEQTFPVNDPIDINYVSNIPIYWMMAISNCGAIDRVRFCPSTQQPPPPLPTYPVLGTANLGWVYSDVLFSPTTGSYGINGWFEIFITQPYPFDNANPIYKFNKPSSVQKPSKTPLFFDATVADTFPSETDAAASDLYTGQFGALVVLRGMGCCTIYRHGGKTVSSSYPFSGATNNLPGAINMGFDDGHADLVPLRNLWNYSWHLNW